MFGWRRRETDLAGRRRASLWRAASEALESRTLLTAGLNPAVPPAGAPPSPGSEFLVNVTTDSSQSTPAVAAGADGTFVVAWQGPDGDGTGIYARRFDAAGDALTGEIAVNADPARAQSRAAVAVGGTQIVVAWQRSDAAGLGDVYARRFDLAGAPAGDEFVVNTLTEQSQSNAAVAAGADGRFVVAWTDRDHDGDGPGVFARRFDPAGDALDAVEFQVNQTFDGGQSAPSVALFGGGGFVIAWQQSTDEAEWRVFFRRYGADGAVLGGETEVTTSAHVGGHSPEPSIAIAADGGFIVAWQAPQGAGAGYGVYARRFDAGGVPSGEPFPVSTRPSEHPLLPSAAATPDGRLMITWQEDRGEGSGTDVYGRRYDAAGVAEGDELLVNTTTADAQTAPAVAAVGNGGLVVAWESAGQDGDGTGVYARLFTTGAANDPPTTSGIAPVSVQEDAADVGVGLFDAFADTSDADAALTYAVAGNSNPSLFRSTAIDPASGMLTLAFAPDASGVADVTVRATDTGGLSVETTFAVTVAAVNDAPVNVVPPAQETPAGTPLVFAAVHHDRIGVDDIDAGAGPLLVTLAATGGTLTLATTAGVSFTAGDGAGDSSMTFTGSPAAVNAALDGMRFDPSPGFSGAASLTITTDDQGHSGSGGAKTDTDTVAITVSDELPPPSVFISGATVTEPDGGETADAVFTVTLSEARPYAVTVQYATQDRAPGVPGFAVAPADYAATSGALTFAPGETSGTITVAVAGDALDEIDEGFSVVLSNPTGGILGNPSAAAGRIVDNDPLPAMSIGDVVIAEGTEPGESFVAEFPVTLSAPSGQQVRVVYRLGGGATDTASRAADYIGSSGILIFEPGETRHVIPFPIVGDALDEADETFSVLLAYREEVNYTFADGQALATIVDDDPTPTLAIADATALEGDSAEGTLAQLVVRLSAPSGQTVSVTYRAQNDTAAAPGDYEPVTGTLTFEPGETLKTVQVRVRGDTTDEPDETLNVFLSAPQHATFADSRGVLRIQDDDPEPVVSVDDLAVTEGHAEAGQPITVTLRLSAPSGKTVSVDYATTAGTAQSGSDFTDASGTVTFAPGEQVKTIELTVLGDRASEADETFAVVLSNAHNAAPAGTGGVVTIRDDDPPALSASDATVVEGNNGSVQAVFTVSLSGPAAAPVTVYYATAAGTAAAGEDFDAASGALVFDIGEVFKTVTVTVRGDTAAEPDETFTLSLSAPAGAEIADGEAVGTISDDDAVSPAPRVTEVLVDGSAWREAFRARLESLGLGSARFGFAIPAGSAQLTTLPWSSVDRITLRFDSDVSVDRDDLLVRGVNIPTYAFADFSYDPASRTATWTLAQPLGRDKVLLDLDGDAGGAAGAPGGASGAGGLLDGEWSNGSATFPSGNGSAGGDFEFRLNTLPGDADRNGRVDALDLYQVRQRLLTSTSAAGAGTYRYGVFHDVNADGRIDSLDLLAVRRGQFQSLPSGEPSGADEPPREPASATRELLFSSVPVLQ